MESIKEVLMRRDGMGEEEATELVLEAWEELHRRLEAGEAVYDICEEYFGLEPDYLEELLFA